ncbi:MAG: HAMP domain-containing protein, partial [Candidatus Cloacimonetes bacterium]|nr:HAMP domain-containing protein [Candidatus Cloacimonadota bacterium]
DAEMQAIIDRITQEPTIYGVVVYDTAARVRLVSQTVDTLRTAPLQSVQTVLATGSREVLLRDFEGERVYSVVRPLRQDGEIVGAIEVAQTLAFVEAEKRQTRERYIVSTALLAVAMTILILWLVQRLVARPLDRLVAAVRALGGGELAHRIDRNVGPGELGVLAREFNDMADRLEAARARVEREAEERLALERRLRETEKMAALGTLAAGLAHEIAAPLHVIRGRAEMLLKREQESGSERNLRIISAQIERITHIVRNLLDYARRREPRMESVPVSRLLDDLLEFLAAEISADGVQVQRTGRVDVAVYGDADLLHQVFINLLLNALQALRGRDSPQLRLDVSTSSTGSVVIDVEDNAGGIEEHMLEVIFDPFVTTKPAETGTGLGLAVARSIVEEHGGRIEAFNRQRDGVRGAVFRVTLPAAPAQEAA